MPVEKQQDVRRWARVEIDFEQELGRRTTLGETQAMLVDRDADLLVGGPRQTQPLRVHPDGAMDVGYGHPAACEPSGEAA